MYKDMAAVSLMYCITLGCACIILALFISNVKPTFNFPLPFSIVNKPYFCTMLSRKLIGFGKLFALLLLFSFSASAGTPIDVSQSHNKRTVTLDKAAHSFHNNMLQPQVAHVNSMPEQSVKPILSSYSAFFDTGSTYLPVQPTGRAKLFVQDADRCEGVSRLLFPFHTFW